MLDLHESSSRLKSGLMQGSTPSSSRAILGRSVQPCKLQCDIPLYHHHLCREKSNSLISYTKLLYNFPVNHQQSFFCPHVLTNLLSDITLGHLPGLPLTDIRLLSPRAEDLEILEGHQLELQLTIV